MGILLPRALRVYTKPVDGLCSGFHLFRSVLLAGLLQFLKITGHPDQELVLAVDHIVVGSGSMVVNIGLFAVAHIGLTAEQLTISGIGLCIDVKGDQSILVDGNHVVEAQQSQSAIIQLHDVLTGLDIGMVGLGGFHGDEILEAAHMEHNTHIGSAVSFVMLNLGVTAPQEADVSVIDTVDTQTLHADSSLSL